MFDWKSWIDGHLFGSKSPPPLSKDGIEGEDGRRANLWDYQVESAGFSLAALEMILGDIVVKVSSMMVRTSIQIAT